MKKPKRVIGGLKFISLAQRMFEKREEKFLKKTMRGWQRGITIRNNY